MLTKNLIESELGLAYLLATAAREGFSLEIMRIDMDSVDVLISARGKIHPSSEVDSPIIQMQLKTTANAMINEKLQINYSLPVKNYNDLKVVNGKLPRLLVLLVLPKNESDWLIHQPDKLILQKCAYFLNLKGMPNCKNKSHKTVHIPAKNILSCQALRELMIKASKNIDL